LTHITSSPLLSVLVWCMQHSRRTKKASKGPAFLRESNTGVAARNQRDLDAEQLDKEQAKDLDLSRRRLEAKAALFVLPPPHTHRETHTRHACVHTA
jgi:hypothetical protein